MESLFTLWTTWAGVALLAIAGIALFVRVREVSTLTAAAGFVAMAIANIAMNVAPKKIQYVHGATGIAGATIRPGGLFQFAQVLSSIGLVVGACGLMIFAVRARPWKFPGRDSTKTDASNE